MMLSHTKGNIFKISLLCYPFKVAVIASILMHQDVVRGPNLHTQDTHAYVCMQVQTTMLTLKFGIQNVSCNAVLV